MTERGDAVTTGSNARGQKALFPEVKKIAAVLSRESEQEVVIIVVPSHDKRKAPLSSQSEWANAGMTLLADLYQGATAFANLKGIFKTEDGHYLHDEPILLESYANNADIEDVDKLNQLVRFLKKMGKETDQNTVMVIIGTAFFYITDYSGA